MRHQCHIKGEEAASDGHLFLPWELKVLEFRLLFEDGENESDNQDIRTG